MAVELGDLRERKARWRRRALGVLVLAALAVVLVRAFRPTPVLVDTSTVRRGPLLVTVDDDGRTRVRERFTISAPIDGRLLRTALDPGDAVLAGETLVAEFVPVAPGLLDARSRAEAEARSKRAEAAVQEAEARAAQAAADVEYYAAELARQRQLVERDVESRAGLERALRDQQRAREGLRAAEFAVQVARYELELARASLVEILPVDADPALGLGDDGAVERAEWSGAVERAPGDGRLLLRSPVDGTVLRVFEEDARTLPAGTPILEVGNTGALEIVADYLSQDAVKVRPGMDVLIEGWGGERPGGDERVLRGQVRVVEPGGFTKVSALGVEEQRVNVVVDPLLDPAEPVPLGDAYRVELRIVLWAADDVLLVPTGALFREGEGWAVFVLDRGHARRRAVQLGQRGGLEAQVLSGLAAGDEVVMYPSDLVDEGTRVTGSGRD